MNNLSTLNQWIEYLYPIPHWILDFAIKGSVVLGIVMCVLVAMRAASASARSLVLRVSMVGLILLPMLILVLPSWHITVPNPSASRLAFPAQGTAPATAAARVSIPVNANSADFRASVSNPTIQLWPAAAWALGATLVFARIIASWIGSSILALRSTRSGPGPVLDSLKRQQSILGMNRKVLLITSSKRSVPMTWGTIRPCILLPAEWEEWDREQLDTVILHELAHIKRADSFAQLVAQLACAIHWFNPLVWVLSWKLSLENEQATDDLVVESGTRPTDYARILLNTVASVAPSLTRPCHSSVTMASSSIDVEKRIANVLDGSLNRQNLRFGAVSFVILSTAMLLTPLAMLEAGDENDKRVSVSSSQKNLAGAGKTEPDSTSASNSVLASSLKEIDERIQHLRMLVNETEDGDESVGTIREAIRLGINDPALEEALRKWENAPTVGGTSKRELESAAQSAFDRLQVQLDQAIAKRNLMRRAQAGRTSRIRVATPKPGIVKQVSVSRGENVEKGEVLLQLNDIEAKGRLDLAMQQLQFAEQSANLKREDVQAADRTLKIITEKHEIGVAIQTHVDEAQKELRAARGALLQSESEIQTASLKGKLAAHELDQLTVRAPAAGRVVEILCHPGEYVSPTSPVVIIEPTGAD